MTPKRDAIILKECIWMESKNIIIVLIIIIVILAVMIGITVLHPFDSKEPSKVKITSNRTLT